MVALDLSFHGRADSGWRGCTPRSSGWLVRSSFSCWCAIWSRPTEQLAAVAYFLFLPYAVIASRSFQPDVLMIMLVICFWWLVLRWSKYQSLDLGDPGWPRRRARRSTSSSSPPSLSLARPSERRLGAFGARLMRKPQVWVMACLGILPASIYIYYGVVEQGFLGRQFSGQFIPALLISPLNYLQWATLANSAAGGSAIALGLLGLLVTATGGQALRPRPLDRLRHFRALL